MSKIDPTRPLQDQILVWLNDVADKRAEMSDIDLPGWTVRKPSLDDIKEDLTILTAQSKDGEHEALVLPDSAEACIAVLDGAIQIDAGDRSISLTGRHFSVLTAGPNRTVIATAPNTRIYATFFRIRGEHAGDSILT